MPSNVSKPTRVMDRASVNIMKAYDRAKGNMADIPLGEKKLDPRTEKKRLAEKQLEPGMDTTLTRMLYTMRQQQGIDQQPNNMESQ